ncbi:hypothetical protein RchiOBHm_Chr5g0068781 [Rosa chinensis]|uniref:Uncharacterized protein n=1 Tax=Rosa chinensis TaxID=74649 RepID=A0A2P6QJS3_ROSCH|nr:hypothetical protein RchiOBHm_Chr5g0068781 [Rosa chinensis]
MMYSTEERKRTTKEIKARKAAESFNKFLGCRIYFSVFFINELHFLDCLKGSTFCVFEAKSSENEI